MVYTKKITKQGNSKGICIPYRIRQNLDLNLYDTVKIYQHKNKIIIEKNK